jgi:hypothetical protein
VGAISIAHGALAPNIVALALLLELSSFSGSTITVAAFLWGYVRMNSHPHFKRNLFKSNLRKCCLAIVRLFRSTLSNNKGKGGKPMKKTSKTLRAAMLLLLTCMILTAMFGGTFAKYTSTYSGQDTALVARWSFTAEGGEITMGAENTELNLFDHLYNTYINQTYGTDVGSDHAQYIIAPGVEDEFTVKMDYIADVDADVVIEIETLEDSANVPMEYSVNGGTNWVDLEGLADALADRIKSTNASGKISALFPDEDGTFRIAAVANNSTDDVNISETVKWRWAYDGAAQTAQGGVVAIASDDDVDTGLGEDSQAAVESHGINNRTFYGIKINITATQVNPAKLTIIGIAPISGATQVGHELTAGALYPVGTTATYQWQRSDNLNGPYANISDAESITYILTDDDLGKYIRVVAIGINETSGQKTSHAVGPITNP